MTWPANIRVVQDSSQVPPGPGPFIKKARLQLQAREKRHSIMNEICSEQGIPLLVTGHHLEDDLVGMFYRLSRCSGLEGNSSLKPYATLPAFNRGSFLDTLIVGHPLLQVPKSRLLATCHAHQFSDYVQDLSNTDAGFTRNSIRNSLCELQQHEPIRASTAALKGALYRMKEAQEEMRLQVKSVIQQYALIGNMPLKSSKLLALDPFSGSIGAGLTEYLPTLVSLSSDDSSKSQNVSESHTDISSKSLLGTGMVHQTGDVVLVIPTTAPPSQHRFWFLNPYVTAKVLLFLAQVVNNKPTSTGFYHALVYSLGLRFAASIRLSKERKIRSWRAATASFHQFSSFDNSLNPVGTAGNQPNFKTIRDAAADGSHGDHEAKQTDFRPQNTYQSTPEDPMYQPFGRLPFLTNLSMSSCLLRPLSGIDLYFRRQQYANLNKDILQTNANTNLSDVASDKTALSPSGANVNRPRTPLLQLPVGPGFLITHEVCSLRNIIGLYHDFDMVPGHFYTYDNRISFRLTFPGDAFHGNEESSSNIANKEGVNQRKATDNTSSDENFLATERAIKKYQQVLGLREWIIPLDPSPRNRVNQHGKNQEANRAVAANQDSVSGSGKLQTLSSGKAVRAFLPSMEYKTREQEIRFPYRLPVFESFLFFMEKYENNSAVAGNSSRVPASMNSTKATVAEVEDAALNDLPIMATTSDDPVASNTSSSIESSETAIGLNIQHVKPSFRAFRQPSSKSLVSQEQDKNHEVRKFEHVLDEELVENGEKDMNLFDRNKPMRFRFCLVTLEALRYLAALAHRSQQQDVLQQLEELRQAYPSDSLSSFPMFIQPDTGFVSIPTHNINLRPIKPFPLTMPQPSIHAIMKGLS
jgi:hypothetical protein